MKTIKVLVRKADDEFEQDTCLPVLVPEDSEIDALAAAFHKAGVKQRTEVFGWQAWYDPQGDSAPPDSRMTFTPAFFSIGVDSYWQVAYTWERGKEEPPVVVRVENGEFEVENQASHCDGSAPAGDPPKLSEQDIAIIQHH